MKINALFIVLLGLALLSSFDAKGGKSKQASHESGSGECHSGSCESKSKEKDAEDIVMCHGEDVDCACSCTLYTELKGKKPKVPAGDQTAYQGFLDGTCGILTDDKTPKKDDKLSKIGYKLRKLKQSNPGVGAIYYEWISSNVPGFLWGQVIDLDFESKVVNYYSCF